MSTMISTVPSYAYIRSYLERHKVRPVAFTGVEDVGVAEHQSELVRLVPVRANLPGSEPISWKRFFAHMETHDRVIEVDERPALAYVAFVIVPRAACVRTLSSVSAVCTISHRRL